MTEPNKENAKRSSSQPGEAVQQSSADTESFQIELTPQSLRQIGPYKLLQKIGEGGMGTVWMAEQQEPVRRQVALKLIKSGIADKQVIARFEAERQALAMMDHACIAKVLDAGTAEDGTPYFVMELVQGTPLNEYCDENRLTPRKRLELFVHVCKAVQHAHQKGIIHRDLKPSNVLVSIHDNKPMPKVIDFGLAKALHHQTQLTDKTVFTEFGQVVGTYQYMSPEQAGRDDLDVDTRTDIYSLGVMLYELLTGSTPIDQETLKQNARLKVLEIIREKDPPRPSHRLSSSREKINTISALRQIQPSKLQQILSGDLDWIIMKALEKVRTRRYETAINFAEDIQRYLDGRPVEARPPSTAYKLSKFLRKNRGLVAAVATIAVLLVAGVASVGWFAITKAKEKDRADKKTIEATKLAESLGVALDEKNLEFARATVNEARLKIRVGQWEDAMESCERALDFEIDNRAEVVLLGSDALAAMGSVERRRSLLAQLDSMPVSPQQDNQRLLDLADISRLEGDEEKYEQQLAKIDVEELAAADQSYLNALRAPSLAEGIPHLKKALEEHPWHFEAFTELLAGLLLLDELDELNALTSNSMSFYSQDPNTYLVRALAAAAAQNEDQTQVFLDHFESAVAPGEAEKAEATIRLVTATRQLKVPWHNEVRKLYFEVSSQLKRLQNEDGESASRLLRLLPRIVVERFNTTAPAGVVMPGLFARFTFGTDQQIATLRKRVEEKPDAVTYCILAELLDTAGDTAAAAEAAIAATKAPTLFPKLRPYACAFAATLVVKQSWTTKDPAEKTAIYQRAASLVKERMELGPLDHLQTCWPLASIVVAANDWELFDEVVVALRAEHGDYPPVTHLEMIAAYKQERWEEALDLAFECKASLTRKNEINQAKAIYRASIEKLEKKIANARDEEPAVEDSP